MGEVRRVVIGADSTVIDLGRRRRLFTGTAPLAVRLTDAECTWPDCHTPASGCEIDHLHPWAHGGPTNPHNGALQRRRHNLQKQTEGWQARRDPGGRWQFRRPDGTTIQGPHSAPPDERDTDQGGLAAA